MVKDRTVLSYVYLQLPVRVTHRNFSKVFSEEKLEATIPSSVDVDGAVY